MILGQWAIFTALNRNEAESAKRLVKLRYLLQNERHG